MRAPSNVAGLERERQWTAAMRDVESTTRRNHIH